MKPTSEKKSNKTTKTQKGNGDKDSTRRENRKSLQKSNRGSSHDLRRLSEDDALDAAAKKFAEAQKNASLPLKLDDSSTLNSGAATLANQNVDDSKLDSTVQSGAVVSPTQLNPSSAEFIPNLNSTLQSGASTIGDESMDCTVIQQTPTVETTASSLAMINALSSTPKGGAAHANQNANDHNERTSSSTMHTGDAALASITTALRFGPRVVSNTDTNQEQSVQTKQKKKRRGDHRYF